MRNSASLPGYAALTSPTTLLPLGRRRGPDGKVCVHILCHDMSVNERFVIAKGIPQRCIPEKIRTEFPAIDAVSSKRYDDLSAADCAFLLSIRCDLLRDAVAPLVEQNPALHVQADTQKDYSEPTQGRHCFVCRFFCSTYHYRTIQHI